MNTILEMTTGTGYRSILVSVTLLLMLSFVGTAAAQDDGYYVVQTGDTLFRIARSHGLTVAALRTMNDLTSDRIRVGQRLRIREKKPVSGWTRPSGGKNDRPVDDLAARGAPDSLAAGAAEMEGGAADRAEADRTPQESVVTASTDSVSATAADIATEREKPAPVELPPHPDGTASFLTEDGDTFYSLAARMSISVDSLELMNPEAPDFLSRATILFVPEEKLTRAYRVRRGDTLFGIANRFSVSASAIRSVNNMKNSNLRAGQKLMIPGQGMLAADDDDLIPGVTAIGTGVIYPSTFVGRIVANGSTYDPTRLTISHPSLPIGVIVLVSATGKDKNTFAEVTDRGFASDPPIIDLSASVARVLGISAGSPASIDIRLVN